MTTNVTCLLGGSSVGAMWQDLNVYGPGGINSSNACNGGQGFVFQNNVHWMERWVMRRIDIEGFCQNIHFMAPISGGTNSYGYGLVDGVWTNQGPGSMGVVVDAGASVYHALGWTYQVNSHGTSTSDEYFHIAGGLGGIGFSSTSENAGAPFTFAHVLNGGSMGFIGAFETFTENTVHTDPGGTFIVVPETIIADSIQGFGTISNYAGTGNTVSIYPVQQLQSDNPFVTAQEGYVEETGGQSAPFFVYDRVPICFGTLMGQSTTQPTNNFVTTFCVDNSGNVTASGGATLGGSLKGGSAYLNSGGNQVTETLTSLSQYGTYVDTLNSPAGYASHEWYAGIEGVFTSLTPNPGDYYFEDVTDSIIPLQISKQGIVVTGTGSTGVSERVSGANPTDFSCWGSGNGAGLPGVCGVYDETNARMIWNSNSSDDLFLYTPITNVSVGAAASYSFLHTGSSSQTGTHTATQFIGSGPSPTVAVGSGAGSSATASVSGSNTAGVISVTTGTGTASGAIATITFAGAVVTAPMGCSLQARSSTSAGATPLLFTTAPTTTSWAIQFAGSPIPSTTYSWSYVCI